MLSTSLVIWVWNLKFPTLAAALADDVCQSKQNNNSGKFQTQMSSDMESITLPYFLNKVIMNGV